MKAVVVGGIGVDVNVPLGQGQWPLDGAADTIFTPGITLGPGHAGSGVALQAGALGAAVTVADVIGEDLFGDFLAGYFTSKGVKLDCGIHPGGTRRSVNLVRADGSRLSLHDPAHPYEWMPQPWWQLDGADWVHVVIVNWARLALRDAVDKGIFVSTDLQDWDGCSEHHKEFAYGADVVFCSAAKIRDRIDAVVSDIFTHGRAKLVVVTRGAEGSLIFQKGEAPQPVAAVQLPGREIIDTNGAGDSFCATFMTRLLAGDPPRRAGELAAIAASFASSFPGTNTHLLTAEELAAYSNDLAQF
jgi:sugar/nucleoside kinase (ribokinase family)